MQLRITKCSQYQKDSLVWQASFLSKEANLPEKFYFLISYHKERGEYVHFLRERPVLNWQASGVFAALVRKYLSSAVITEILADEEAKNLWLPLKHQAQEWWLHIQHEGAVAVSLINPEGESLIRLGAKGIFTKKKTQELPLAIRASLRNRMDDFVKMLETQEAKPGKIDEPSESGEGQESLELSFFQREGRRRLARKLKTVRQALQKLLKERTSDEELSLLDKNAKYLQVFLHNVSPGASSLLLNKEEIGEESDLLIPLDKDRSAGQNLSAIFEKLKKEKQSRQVWQSHFAKVEQELLSLEEELRKFDSTILREDDIAKSLRKFNLTVEKPKPLKSDQSSLPYKIYKSSEGLDILVGKGSHENDEMTKAARSNDHWFHAIGLGGSHIIISAQKNGELSTKTKREAAILALHFSKVRKDLGGEVYVTRRRSLTKKKGMPPGLWSVQQAETFYLTYTEDELKALLNNR